MATQKKTTTRRAAAKPRSRAASSRGDGPFGELRALATLADAIQGRARLANVAGVTFGGKRDLYETCGYDREITPVQYRSRYRRDAVAKRIVEGFPIDTWRGGFELVDNQDLDTETKFEAAWNRLATRLNLVDTFKQVDILARIGRYAVLVIGAPGEVEQPLTSCTEKNLAYVSLYAEEDASIQEYDTDTKSPRFGLPTYYQIKRKTAKAGTAQKVVNLDKRIHWTRVQHVAENLLEDRVFGTPALECVWNLLDDLAKVTGGGAEAFWQRANQGMHVDIDASLNPSPEEKEAMREAVEKYRHHIDRVLRTRGTKINMLGSDTADIKGPQSAIIEQISAGTGYPTRVLMGSEQGKLAAEQDSVKYYRMCEGRRIGYAETIVRNFVAWMVKLGVLPKPANDEFEVRWSQLQAMDDSEKADLAVKLNSLNANGEVVVTSDELREVLGREPLAEVDPDADAMNKGAGTPAPKPADGSAGLEPTVAAGKEAAAWKKIHRAADRFRPKLKRAALKAFDAGRVALNRPALEMALSTRMEAEAFALVSGAILAMSNELRPALEEVLGQVLGAAGKAVAPTIPDLTAATAGSLRALAPKVGFKFDATNPRAVEWIEEHAAETIDGINETTREAIRDVIEAAFEDQFEVKELADRIEELIGDADRAENIARTETMTASNQGQLEAWSQATDAGLLAGDEKKEWIVTPDDRLCPICEPLDGQQVEMGGLFKTELGDVDAPPVHPRCRCTIGLVAGA